MLRLLIETCVHRRVAALFATLIVAAFGLRAYLDTPIEAYPDVTNTQVTVIGQLPGSNRGLATGRCRRSSPRRDSRDCAGSHTPGRGVPVPCHERPPRSLSVAL